MLSPEPKKEFFFAVQLLPVPLPHSLIFPSAVNRCVSLSHMQPTYYLCSMHAVPHDPNISCRCQQMSHQTLRLIMLSRIANTSCCVTTEKVLAPAEPAPLTSVISSVVLNQWQRYLGPTYFLYLFSPKSQDRSLRRDGGGGRLRT